MNKNLPQPTIIVEVELDTLGLMEAILAQLSLPEQRIPCAAHLNELRLNVLLSVWERLQKTLRVLCDVIHLFTDGCQVSLSTKYASFCEWPAVSMEWSPS